MKVILMTDVPALGHRGETRDVANGYARNFLLPRKLAVPATPANLKNVEHLKRQRAKEDHQALEAAKAAAARIEALTLTRGRAGVGGWAALRLGVGAGRGRVPRAAPAAPREAPRAPGGAHQGAR